MPHLTLNHKALYYEQSGAGEVLVLIHSALMDQRLWQPQREHLAPHFRLLTYDLYGYGNSAFTEARQMEHADDLALLLDALGYAEVHLLGVSMGGEIAQRFTLEYPERVQSLMLVGAGLEGYDYPDDAFGWWASFIEAIRANERSTAGTIFMENALNPKEAPLTAEQYAFLQNLMGDYTFKHYVDDTLLWKGYDRPVIERLAEITCPTLLVVGEADTAVTHAIAQWTANRISGARLERIPRAGHLPNVQQPARFNDTVLAFLQNLRSDR